MKNKDKSTTENEELLGEDIMLSTGSFLEEGENEKLAGFGAGLSFDGAGLGSNEERRQRIAVPLAERMRPTTLDDFVGQRHIMGKGKLLRRLVETSSLGSCIFYGAPGTGKTTLASIIARGNNANFVQLNAVSSGVADAKAVIEKARHDKQYGRETYLLLDECHRWSKAQSDCVLSAIERGEITFIGSTTENPFHSMTKAFVSRCRIFEFRPLEKSDIIWALERALKDKINGLGSFKVEIDPKALEHFSTASGGDLRNSLNALELAVMSTPSDSTGLVKITPEIAEECTGKKLLSLDDSMFYDMLSAFCKSLRGTDPSGAVYWATRLIEGGVDPLIILRRLIVHSSEDVGLANSQALTTAVSALTAYQNLGMPEGLIPLTHAIIAVATSPKSNAVVEARDRAKELVAKTERGAVPNHLKNHATMHEKRANYKYPHSYGGYVRQQYLPDEIKGEEIYVPTENGNEAKIKAFLDALKELK